MAALSGNAQTGAAVKADAYGLGALEVVPRLWQAGCRDFFVAHWGEAEANRTVESGEWRALPCHARQRDQPAGHWAGAVVI